MNKIRHIIRMARRDCERADTWEERYAEDVPFLIELVERLTEGMPEPITAQPDRFRDYIAANAANLMVECPHCEGSGSVSADGYEEPCPTCDENGEISLFDYRQRVGDMEALP